MIDLLQTHDLTCPYCGEDIQMVIDFSVASQEYIEDCQVCCRPINLVINIDDEIIDIRVSHENE